MRKTCYCFHCNQLMKFDIKNQFNVEMGGIPLCFSCDEKQRKLMRDNAKQISDLIFFYASD